MFYLSGKKESKNLSIQRRIRRHKIAIIGKIDFWRNFFEGLNRLRSSSWNDWCAPGAPGRSSGWRSAAAAAAAATDFFFFVKQKVAIARVVASGFLGRLLWGAKHRENYLFFVKLLHAIGRGSSPVHGTIFKIARFVDIEKLWLNQVSLLLSKGKCNKIC